MDIKNLITFIHVAELNSFSKAAEILNFSQSTVSFQIKQLESELNTPLFDRINRTVSLTPKGREVLDYAHQITKLAQELEDSLLPAGSVVGEVRLGVPDSLCSFLLGEGFLPFRKRFPGISLKVIAAGTEEMFRLLNHNEADLILILDSPIYNNEYRIVREERISTHFVAAAHSPLAGKKDISIPELICYPMLLTEKGMSYRRLMEEQLARLSLEIQPILETSRTDLICSLTAQDLGITFLPDYATEGGIRSGSLTYLDVKGFEIDVRKQLLYHRDKWVSPQMECVLRYCQDKAFT